MNTTRGQTAQVPGQRSKTFGDHLKAALPWIGTAAAIGGLAYGFNKYDQNHKFKPLDTLPNNPIDSRRRPSDDDGSWERFKEFNNKNHPKFKDELSR
jgi:hypothetical protein